MALPATAIYYVGYDHMRDYARLKFRDNLVDTYSPLWAGGVARSKQRDTLPLLQYISLYYYP